MAGRRIGGNGAIHGNVTVTDGALESGTPAALGPSLVITSGTLTMLSPAVFAIRLDGRNPGTGYDQVQVVGNVNLGNTGNTSQPTIALSISPGFAPTITAGEQFDILHVVRPNPNILFSISGMFANAPSVIQAGGHYFSVTYTSTDVTLTALPGVAAVQINDGSAQRSEVQSITVTFTDSVTFAGNNPVAAFQLQSLTDSNNVALTAAVSTDGFNRTVVTLTFSGSRPTRTPPANLCNPWPTGFTS